MLKGQLVFVFLAFLLKHKVIYATTWATSNTYSEFNVTLQGFTFESSSENTILECYRKCEQNILCSTININLTDMTCERKYSTKTRHPEKTVRYVPNMIYMETRDDLGPPGSRPDRPIPSCKKLKEDDSQAKSGVYWMKFNEPSSAPFQVFCDMTTDGGGWTLAYSYTFMRYHEFNTKPNAVTPIPNWPVNKTSGTWVSMSTTTPLSESTRSAMEFALWKKIGRDFLIKSNITNWVVCEEGTGSLVTMVKGTLSCRVVNAITPTCRDIAPNDFVLYPPIGPLMRTSTTGINFQFYFDGRTDDAWPTHDPCGTNSGANHIQDASNFGGAIYLR